MRSTHAYVRVSTRVERKPGARTFTFGHSSYESMPAYDETFTLRALSERGAQRRGSDAPGEDVNVRDGVLARAGAGEVLAALQTRVEDGVEALRLVQVAVDAVLAADGSECTNAEQARERTSSPALRCGSGLPGPAWDLHRRAVNERKSVIRRMRGRHGAR